MKILVTGACGFIGYHCVKRLVRDGHEVVGLDDYTGGLSWERRQEQDDRLIYEGDIADRGSLYCLPPADVVLHLAAKPGVRGDAPDYVQPNLVGFANVLEYCKSAGVKHLVYASSSSVYEGKSFYAATKIANEAMAKTYDFPTTGLRYFTVYGPWGRPDMTPMLFADAITEGRPVTVYEGMERAYTYIDDVVDATVRAVVDKPFHRHRVKDVGYARLTPVSEMAWKLSKALGVESLRLQFSKPPETEAAGRGPDFDMLDIWTPRPRTSLDDGLTKFAEWYGNYKQNL